MFSEESKKLQINEPLLIQSDETIPLDHNAYSINYETRFAGEEDDSDEEQATNNRLSHHNHDEEHQHETNLEYRELRDRNSVIYRNFQRFPKTELTVSQRVETFQQKRTLKTWQVFDKVQIWQHPFNEVMILLNYRQETKELVFDLYQGQMLANLNRQRIISLSELNHADNIGKFEYFCFHISQDEEFLVMIIGEKDPHLLVIRIDSLQKFFSGEKFSTEYELELKDFMMGQIYQVHINRSKVISVVTQGVNLYQLSADVNKLAQNDLKTLICFNQCIIKDKEKKKEQDKQMDKDEEKKKDENQDENQDENKENEKDMNQKKDEDKEKDKKKEENKENEKEKEQDKDKTLKKELNDYKIEESLFFGYNSNTKEICCYNLEHNLQMELDVKELDNLHWLHYSNNFLYIQQDKSILVFVRELLVFKKIDEIILDKVIAGKMIKAFGDYLYFQNENSVRIIRYIPSNDSQTSENQLVLEIELPIDSATFQCSFSPLLVNTLTNSKSIELYSLVKVQIQKSHLYFSIQDGFKISWENLESTLPSQTFLNVAKKILGKNVAMKIHGKEQDEGLEKIKFDDLKKKFFDCLFTDNIIIYKIDDYTFLLSIKNLKQTRIKGDLLFIKHQHRQLYIMKSSKELILLNAADFDCNTQMQSIRYLEEDFFKLDLYQQKKYIDSLQANSSECSLDEQDQYKLIELQNSLGIPITQEIYHLLPSDYIIISDNSNREMRVFIINQKDNRLESIIITQRFNKLFLDRIQNQHFYLTNHKKYETQKIDLLDDIKGPGSLPVHLIFINKYLPIPGKFVTTYDIDQGVVSIFDDYESYSAGRVKSKILIKTCYQSFIGIFTQIDIDKIDPMISHIKDLEGRTLLQLAEYVRNSNQMSELLSYNTIYGTSLLALILRDKNARTVFCQKLDALNADDLKYIDIFSNFKKETALDFVMDKDVPDNNAIRALMQFMGQTDQTGLLYQSFVHKHLKCLMEKRVPLQEYFKSPLAHRPVENDQLEINLSVYDQKTLISQLLVYVKQDINYLDILSVQKIIQWKWENHAKSKFLIEFCLLLAFTLCYFISMFTETTSYWLTIKTASNVAGALFVLFFINIERIQFMTNGPANYFSNIWNLTDFALIVFYLFGFIPLEFIISPDSSKEMYLAWKSINFILIILFFVSINQYLQIFELFSFLVQMIEAVFMDLKNFIIYYFLVMTTFGFIFKILFEEPSADCAGFGPFSFILMSLRIVWGEGSFEIEKTDYKIIGWLTYIMLMLTGNIVLLNFIIAVVQQSYEYSMQKMKFNYLKAQLRMINDYYMTLTDEDFQDSKKFPDKIVHDRDQIGEEENDQQKRFFGIVLAIKNHIDRQVKDIKKTQISGRQFKEIVDHVRLIDNKFETNQKKLLDNQIQFQLQQEKQMEDIRKQMQQVLEAIQNRH